MFIQWGRFMRSCISILLKWLAPPLAQGGKLTLWERLLISWLFLLGLGLFMFISGIWDLPLSIPSVNHFGFYCPGCGGSRALNYLLQGQFFMALRHNMLFILMLPMLLQGSFYLFRAIISGYLPVRLYISPIFLWLLLSAVLLFTALRNIPTPALDFLRPPVQ